MLRRSLLVVLFRRCFNYRSVIIWSVFANQADKKAAKVAYLICRINKALSPILSIFWVFTHLCLDTFTEIAYIYLRR